MAVIFINEVTSLQFAILVFFALCIGHALGDYPLQGRFLSLVKNRHADISEFFPDGESARFAWVHAMTCHALIHAGLVWLVTGSPLFAMLELGLHWVIDFSKCEGFTNFHSDQILHYTCKLGYVICLLYGIH